IQAHVEQPPRPLHEHGDCPPELEAAILRMLAKNPEERWPSMTPGRTALGAAALPEDDPARAELSRFAMAGSRTTFVSGNGSRAGRYSAVLQADLPGVMHGVGL